MLSACEQLICSQGRIHHCGEENSDLHTAVQEYLNTLPVRLQQHQDYSQQSCCPSESLA